MGKAVAVTLASAGQSRSARAGATIARILDAAIAVLCTEGAAAVSVQRVATAAGTSKALVHYHFSGKDELLCACIERLGAELASVEGGALDGSSPERALDDLWRAVMRGSILQSRRALLALTTDATAHTRPVLARVAADRQRAAHAVMKRLGALMHFRPSVSDAAIAMAYVALADGLTLNTVPQMTEHHRPAFDAFWLGVLSLDR